MGGIRYTYMNRILSAFNLVVSNQKAMILRCDSVTIIRTCQIKRSFHEKYFRNSISLKKFKKLQMSYRTKHIIVTLIRISSVGLSDTVELCCLSHTIRANIRSETVLTCPHQTFHTLKPIQPSLVPFTLADTTPHNIVRI